MAKNCDLNPPPPRHAGGGGGSQSSYSACVVRATPPKRTSVRSLLAEFWAINLMHVSSPAGPAPTTTTLWGIASSGCIVLFSQASGKVRGQQ